jgi:hypothetical protein
MIFFVIGDLPSIPIYATVVKKLNLVHRNKNPEAVNHLKMVSYKHR